MFKLNSFVSDKGSSKGTSINTLMIGDNADPRRNHHIGRNVAANLLAILNDPAQLATFQSQLRVVAGVEPMPTKKPTVKPEKKVTHMSPKASANNDTARWAVQIGGVEVYSGDNGLAVDDVFRMWVERSADLASLSNGRVVTLLRGDMIVNQFNG